MAHSISVIIPTYNGARYIGEALRSVFAQTLLPAEIIVVDDVSIDDTLDVVRHESLRSPVPVRIMGMPRNSGGPAAPINAGIASAHGDLIAVLDQDDLMLPGKIESQARVLLEEPKVSLSASLCAFYSAPAETLPWQLECCAELMARNRCGASDPLPGREVLRQLILQGNFLVGYPAFMFRTADWRKKGGVAERLPIASDYDMLCWLCTQGEVVVQRTAQYLRREHDANVCNDRQEAFLDGTRVRAHYLRQERWLLDDESISRPMQEWFLGFGYWLREAGNYRAAWACFRQAASLWGWNRRSIRSACTLLPHWAWRKLTNRAAIFNGYTRRSSRRPETAIRGGARAYSN